MKTRHAFVVAGALLLAAGCASVDSRIAKNRATFESWPFAVQQKVAAGEVDLTFTPDQVWMALGEPDRVATRTSADGDSQSWIYRDRGPRFGFGLGLGSWHGGSAYGMGVGVNNVPLGPDDSMRVTFTGGVVSAIETAHRD